MPEKDAKIIMAENIKLHMKRKDVTIQRLCDDLGFKYTTVRDWVNGITYPRMPKVEAMADYFGILKSDLIEERTPERDGLIKKSSVIADAALRMKTDDEFFSIVEMLLPLDQEKTSDAKQLISIITK